MAACAVSPTLPSEAGAAATPVVTCRKMRPKVSPDLWCRSCAMNLKKRCGGLLASPEVPRQSVNSRSTGGSGCSGDTFVIDGCPSSKTTSLVIESNGVKGKSLSGSVNDGHSGVLGRKRYGSSSPGWVPPSPQPSDAPLRNNELARHKRPRSSSSKAAGQLKVSNASGGVNNLDNGSDGASDSVGGSDASAAEEEAAAAAAAAEETWVQCESCTTWRQLPKHVNPDDLPDVWFCYMNEWNPAERTCVNNAELNGRSQRRCTAADAALVHKILGVQSVEQVKELNRARGLRTTRVGTNGGRKSKGELIEDLLDDGLMPADVGADITATSADYRAMPSPRLLRHARNSPSPNESSFNGKNSNIGSNIGSNGKKGVRHGHHNSNTGGVSGSGAKKSRLQLLPPNSGKEDMGNQLEGDNHFRPRGRARANTCDDLPSPLSAPWPEEWPGRGHSHHRDWKQHRSTMNAHCNVRNRQDAQIEEEDQHAWRSDSSKWKSLSSGGRRERADSWPASSSKSTRHFEPEVSSGRFSSGSARDNGLSGSSSTGGAMMAGTLSERRLTADAVADAERFRAYVRSRIQQTPSPVLTCSSASSLAHSPSVLAPYNTAEANSSSSLPFEHRGAAAAVYSTAVAEGAAYTTPEVPSTSASNSEASSSLFSCCPLASLAEVACIALEYPNHATPSSDDAPTLPRPAGLSSISSSSPSSFSAPAGAAPASTAFTTASSFSTSSSCARPAPSAGVLTPAPPATVAQPLETPVPFSSAAARALTPGAAPETTKRHAGSTCPVEASTTGFIDGFKASSETDPTAKVSEQCIINDTAPLFGAGAMTASGLDGNAHSGDSSSPQPMALDQCLAMVERNSKRAAGLAAAGSSGRFSGEVSDGSEECDKDSVLLLSEDQCASANEEMAYI